MKKRKEKLTQLTQLTQLTTNKVLFHKQEDQVLFQEKEETQCLFQEKKGCSVLLLCSTTNNGTTAQRHN